MGSYGVAYTDSVTKGESFAAIIELYSEFNTETMTGTPLDLTGCSATGYVTPNFNSSIQTPLTIVFDTPPTTGVIFFSMSESTVETLQVGINKLRIYLTDNSGSVDLLLESPSFTVRI